MKKPKILVVGSFVLDQIATTKIVPKEGETVLGESFSKAPGGKGVNQAVQAAKLGAEVTMIGKLGRDSNGEELLSACKEAGICTDDVLYDENTASGCAVITLEKKEDGSVQNRILVIPGANMTITPEEVAFLKEEIENYDMVLLQLEIPMAVNRLVAEYAYGKKVPVMLNSAPSAPLAKELFRCLTFISPNEHEAEDLTGIHIRRSGRKVCQEDVKRAGEILMEKGVKNVLITLGCAGAALLNKDGYYFSPSVEGVCAVDPTAAGDSFVGAFCTGYCSGLDIEESMDFANRAAAVTVSGMGAIPSLPTLGQVRERSN